MTDATLYSPTRGLWLFLRSWWRRRRCPHVFLAEDGFCAECGKED